jgi:hypothetical protein
MIQILYGDEGHKNRCQALAGTVPGCSIADANGPALDKKVLNIDTLSFWGHGDASHFCRMTSTEFVDKVKEWMKWNPSIKTLEIITCNSRHGTIDSYKKDDGTVEISWIKSYTDQVKPGLKKLGLTVKALPMGMGMGSANRWSVLRFSPTTNTWLYVTGNGEKDTDEMWPGVNKVENDPLFQSTKNYVIAGSAVKARDTMRRYTIDFGSIGNLRDALVTLA